MLQQDYNIAYLNSTQENWDRGVMGGEVSKQKDLEEREKDQGKQQLDLKEKMKRTKIGNNLSFGLKKRIKAKNNSRLRKGEKGKD